MKVLGLLVVLPILIEFTDAAVTTWNDGTNDHSGADVTITVASDENIADTAAVVTLTATGTSVSSYSIDTQTNAGQFEITNAGVVSLASGQTLDRETDASVVLKVLAPDTGDSTTGTCTLSITVNDLNDNTPTFTAPATSPHSVEIADGSTASTALYTVTATDADATGSTITYSINSGDTNGDFSIASSGAITVATGKTLAKSTTPSYALVIHAVDSAGTPNTGSATLSVTVCDPCSNGTGRHAAGFLSFIIALLMCIKKAM